MQLVGVGKYGTKWKNVNKQNKINKQKIGYIQI